MRSSITSRLRGSSLSSVPPAQDSSNYSTSLASLAAQILYRSPLPSKDGLPIFVLNAAAFPDAKDVYYDALLPYVLSRLPGEDELIGGRGYEVIFFASGGGDGPTAARKGRPGWGWFVQAYHVLTRAMRKRLQKLYIVHERSWVRVLVEMFSTIVSPKFRKKIVHVSSLTSLALYLPIEDLLIPPSAYLHDRRLSPDIYAPYVTGKRAFAAKEPLPRNVAGELRLPRVLRETSAFVLMDENPKTEGIFRIPPHSRLLNILREAYDRGQKFIVWKEQNTVLPAYGIGKGTTIDKLDIEEIKRTDGYGVLLAAGLIKLWYRELLNPVFPQHTYRELVNVAGREDETIEQSRLVELFSPHSQWSVLPMSSRLIVTRHLLPLLSKVASFQEYNQMTPFNLAICFSPALICGPDPVEDAKINGILCRVLESAIQQWEEGLREACGVEASMFDHALQGPPNDDDYEDPLEPEHRTSAIDNADAFQMRDNGLESGVTMQEADKKPPLPYRFHLKSDEKTDIDDIRRKPAPSLSQPPRYSMVIEDGTLLPVSPSSTSTTSDSFQGPTLSITDSDTNPDIRIATIDTVDTHDTELTPSPKRKPVKTEQSIETAFEGSEARRQRKASDPGPISIKRKPLQPPSPTDPSPVHSVASISYSTELSESLGRIMQKQRSASERSNAPPQLPTPEISVDGSNDEAEFLKPDIPAVDRGRARSLSKVPTIQRLAQPIYPSSSTSSNPSRSTSTHNTSSAFTTPFTTPFNTTTNSSTSSSLPAPHFPKKRVPSPALTSRMPSLSFSNNTDTNTNDPGTETTAPPHRSKSDAGPLSSRLPPPPRRLNLKLGQGSVDDLRRLYEERARAAGSLVEAGKGSAGGGGGGNVGGR
ncbi:MAG: hypothetical protein M1819_005040 [Sarea resinae]|nr:MAG: hypothetical protein M1819_005040 [Sarea resinae]